MNTSKARINPFYPKQHFTRKDRRKNYDNADYLWMIGTGWRKDLKRATARKSRRRKIADETPYKKLVDPWAFD
jgi:hypothetical protein